MSDTRSTESTPTTVDEAMRLLHFVARHFGGVGEGAGTALISHLRLKIDLPGRGAVELELNSDAQQATTAPESTTPREFGARFFAASQSALPCQPANDTAAAIMRTCDEVFDANQGDCNQFLKAAVAPYFGNPFDGLNADNIIAMLSDPTNGWTSSQSIPDAIANAQNGLFVIAGMTSAQLGQNNGHVAVVVGCPGGMSGTVNVPIGYAGSIGTAQIRGEKLSLSFPRTAVQDSSVSYFSKAPTN